MQPFTGSPGLSRPSLSCCGSCSVKPAGFPPTSCPIPFRWARRAMPMYWVNRESPLFGPISDRCGRIPWKSGRRICRCRGFRHPFGSIIRSHRHSAETHGQHHQRLEGGPRHQLASAGHGMVRHRNEDHHLPRGPGRLFPHLSERRNGRQDR